MDNCEYCSDLGRYKGIQVELFHQTAVDEIYEIDIPLNFCPNCGNPIKEKPTCEVGDSK